MKYLFLILFLVSCGGGSGTNTVSNNSEVKTINVFLLHVNSKYAWKTKEAEQITLDAFNYLENRINFKFNLIGVNTVEDPAPEIDGLENFYNQNRFKALNNELILKKQCGSLNANHLCLVIDKPIFDSNLLYNAGWAHICGYNNNKYFAAVFLRRIIEPGNYIESVLFTAHEIAHALGGVHIDSTINLMQSNLDTSPGLEMPILNNTVLAINTCTSDELLAPGGHVTEVF